MIRQNGSMNIFSSKKKKAREKETRSSAKKPFAVNKKL